MEPRIIHALVDGLIAQAEALPKRSVAASCFRDAAASLLDAGRSLELEWADQSDGRLASRPMAIDGPLARLDRPAA
ncbi:hypothetical protein [Caulobacter sp. DWP3-1-3b2]|uniref:hypothetical protein n=1 Tax=Caulobacter sp. DWP3-1-3b2 TaxID=2804643 RepID=UPI003CF1482D